MTLPIAITIPAAGRGFTPERKALFLDRLATHGNARAACRSVGLSAEAAYRLRRRDGLFARGWAAAVVLGRENCVQVLGERAVEGIEEDIYFRGEVVGTRRRYDNRLLLAHLARLDRLADEPAAAEDAGRFDELLVCIAEDNGSEPLSDRAACVEQATLAVEEYRRRELKSHDNAVNAATHVNGELDLMLQRRAKAVIRLERECAERATQARDEAAAAWDRRRATVVAKVEALCAAPEAAAPASITPAEPECAAAPSAVAPLANAERTFVSRTLSTASTAALASAIAGTHTPHAQTPCSPLKTQRS